MVHTHTHTNLSLQQILVPVDWKTAKVTPFYKGKGSHSDSTFIPSYFCYLSHCQKSLKNVSQLLDYLEKYDFTSCDQSAFLNKHSTVTAIHKIVDNWIQYTDEAKLPVYVFLI